MRKLWRGIANIFFWSYERGSWPYDVLVAAILIFLLATPRHWFQDGPRPSLPASSDIQLIEENNRSNEATYRVDARLLGQTKATTSTPELERRAHDILGAKVPALGDRIFQVERIDFVRGGDGALLDFDVTVRVSDE